MFLVKPLHSLNNLTVILICFIRSTLKNLQRENRALQESHNKTNKELSLSHHEKEDEEETEDEEEDEVEDIEEEEREDTEEEEVSNVGKPPFVSDEHGKRTSMRPNTLDLPSRHPMRQADMVTNTKKYNIQN